MQKRAGSNKERSSKIDNHFVASSSPSNIAKAAKRRKLTPILKKMAENNRTLQSSSSMEQKYITQSDTVLPDSLEDVASDDECSRSDNVELPSTISQFDEFLKSESVDRIRKADKFWISFGCPLFEQIGQSKRAFRFSNLDELRQCCQANADATDLTELDLLFLAGPNIRSALFERLFNDQNGRIPVKFGRFAQLLCYIFQAPPSFLFGEIEEQTAEFGTAFSKLRVEDEKQVEGILQKNIHLLFADCWPFLDFSDWKVRPLVSLLHAFSRIYLDRQMFDFRVQMAVALKELLAQLPADRSSTLLNKFFTTAFLPAAGPSSSRALTLFRLFSQSDRFSSQHQLLALRTFLRSFIPPTHKQAAAESDIEGSLTLGGVFALLPTAVAQLKKRGDDSYSDLYAVFTLWPDALTANVQLLLMHESDHSLECAEKAHEKAALRLKNTKNINDRMIETWSQAKYGICRILQIRRLRQTPIHQKVEDNSSEEEEIE